MESFSTTKEQGIITELEQQFRYIGKKETYGLFPFSNEVGHDAIIEKLNRKEEYIGESTPLAMLFGESSVLSLLPVLAKRAKVVILADVEPNLPLHTRHLLNCMENSASIKEFTLRYRLNYPKEITSQTIKPKQLSDFSVLPNYFHEGFKTFNPQVKKLGKHHFLASEEKFAECKEALKKVSIAHIRLDLFDKIDCQKLATYFKNNDCILTFCNFNNIHEFDKLNLRKESISKLLEHSPSCWVMYSNDLKRKNIYISKLKTSFFSSPLEKYFNKAKQTIIPNNISWLDQEINKIYTQLAAENNPKGLTKEQQEFKEALLKTIQEKNVDKLFRQVTIFPGLFSLFEKMLENSDTLMINIFAKTQTGLNALQLAQNNKVGKEIILLLEEAYKKHNNNEDLISLTYK